MDTEKKENKEVNKLSLLIVAVIVLVLIIAGDRKSVGRERV